MVVVNTIYFPIDLLTLAAQGLKIVNVDGGKGAFFWQAGDTGMLCFGLPLSEHNSTAGKKEINSCTKNQSVSTVAPTRVASMMYQVLYPTRHAEIYFLGVTDFEQ